MLSGSNVVVHSMMLDHRLAVVLLKVGLPELGRMAVQLRFPKRVTSLIYHARLVQRRLVIGLLLVLPSLPVWRSRALQTLPSLLIGRLHLSLMLPELTVSLLHSMRFLPVIFVDFSLILL